MNDRERLLNEIDVIGELEDDWNGCSARKPFIGALRDIHLVVCMFNDNELEYCSVFPSDDGGVYLQYRRGAVSIIVWVDGHRLSSVLKNGLTGEKYYVHSMEQLSKKIDTILETPEKQ